MGLGQFLFKIFFELEGDVCILHSILGLLVQRDITHITLIFSFFTYQFGDRLCAVVQIGFRQNIHVMSHIRIYDIMSDHGVIVWSDDLEVVFEQNF